MNLIPVCSRIGSREQGAGSNSRIHAFTHSRIQNSLHPTTLVARQSLQRGKPAHATGFRTALAPPYPFFTHNLPLFKS
ncbi:MAG: hypothetical protein ACRCZS_24985 [Chroococcidiopsis sp.]